MTDTKKELIRSFKFVMFSISAGIIQIIVDTVMNEFVKSEAWISYIAALCASVLWNFTFNRKFTFHSAGNIPIAMLKVAAFYAVFAPLSTWWTAVLTGSFGWNEYLVLALTMIVNFVTEYIYQRFVVFGKTLDTDKEVQNAQ
jgi:putative flippase GtrA